MNKRRALAKAVYPGIEVFWDLDDESAWFYVEGEPATFDPENNSDQFCDVLAWLLTYDLCARVESDCVFHDDGSLDYERPLLHVDHDGTASGIRRAVVQAAERCV